MTDTDRSLPTPHQHNTDACDECDAIYTMGREDRSTLGVTLAAAPAPLDRLRARISLEAINGTRPVWVAEGVFERYTARTAEGWPVTIEWGEPDADGFYSPVFTEHPEP